MNDPGGNAGSNDGRSDNWGGTADSNISAPAANADMSLADQYAEYGAGRAAAEKAAGYGVGADGYQSSEADRQSFLDADIAAPAPAPAATKSPIEAIGRALLGLLGIASGTPQGVIGGAMSLNNVFNGIGSFGTPGTGGMASVGADNRTDAITAGSPVGGSPVLGWGGSVVNGGKATAPAYVSGSPGVPIFPGLGSLGYGYVPGGTLQSPAGFAGGARQSSNALPVLLLAGLSYLVMT